jgi:hypothetical protein
MKNICTLLVLTLLGSGLSAQGVFTNQTNGALEKVIQDYPNKFRNIKGNLLTSNQQEEEYRSSITIPGALNTTVIQFNNPEGHTLCWQSTLYAAHTFDDASNKFKELFAQIKNTIIKMEGERPVILNGKFESPQEEKKCTTIYFDILPANSATLKIKVDLSLEKEAGSWKIVLSVYDKSRKENEAIVSTQEK